LNGFASEYGASFYGLPYNEGTVTLTKESWDVPATYRFGSDELVPLRAGEKILWRVAR
jgi:dihydroorotase